MKFTDEEKLKILEISLKTGADLETTARIYNAFKGTIKDLSNQISETFEKLERGDVNDNR